MDTGKIRMRVRTKRVIVVVFLLLVTASSIGFSALSIAAFLSDNIPIALGALGPATVCLAYSIGFIRRLVAERGVPRR